MGIYLLLSLILLGIVYLIFFTRRVGARLHHSAGAAQERRRADAADEGSAVARLVNTILREAIAQNAGELVLQPEADHVRLILPTEERPLTLPVDNAGVRDEVRLPRQVFPLLLDRLKHMAHVSLEIQGAELRGRIRIRHQTTPWDITAHFAPTADGGAEQVTLRFAAGRN